MIKKVIFSKHILSRYKQRFCGTEHEAILRITETIFDPDTVYKKKDKVVYVKDKMVVICVDEGAFLKTLTVMTTEYKGYKNFVESLVLVGRR